MKKNAVKTITKLVEVKERAVERAEQYYAAEHAAVAVAQQRAEQARRAWNAAMDEPFDGVATAADLADRDLRIRALRRASEAAERDLAAAQAREASARVAMVAARIEQQRFEMWLERESRKRAEERRRAERVAEDEVAARATARATGS
jgi:flagellar biosynthesis chaperone FliJ